MNENQDSAERNEGRPASPADDSSPRGQRNENSPQTEFQQENRREDRSTDSEGQTKQFTPRGQQNESDPNAGRLDAYNFGKNQKKPESESRNPAPEKNASSEESKPREAGNEQSNRQPKPETGNNESSAAREKSTDPASSEKENPSANQPDNDNERRQERRNQNNRRQNNRKRNPNQRQRNPNRSESSANAPAQQSEETESRPRSSESAPQGERQNRRHDRPERVRRVENRQRDDKNQNQDQNQDDAKPRQHSLHKPYTNDRISIVIPLYNEEESIKPLYSQIRNVFENTRRPYEIVFVDDGSTDKSLVRIREICRVDRRSKYISFQKNYGKSAALQMGFKAATGGIIITMDADLQDDPKEIPHLIRKLNEGYDLVSGWKKKRFDPFVKKFSSKFFNFTTRVISGIKIHDFNCGLKAYRKEAADSILVYGELHRYMPVLAHWNGFSVTEVEVRHHPRMYGKTKFGISRFFKGFVDLLTVVFLTRYIKRPMHLFGFLGAIATFAGIGVNGYLTYEWIMGQPLSNRPMLFLGMLLIIVGVQFFSTGLLGELMVHNFQSDKEYNIKEKSN